MPDEETAPNPTPPATAPFTVVRVTWLDDDGIPDHRRALTYHFAQPVTFAFLSRPDPNAGHPDDGTAPGMAAFAAERDHPESLDVAALGQGLWQCRRAGAVVDAWSPTPDGRWFYALVPGWRYAENSDWRTELKPDLRVHAVGRAWRVKASFRWNDSRGHGHHDIPAGSYLHTTTVKAPPPPLGFPPAFYTPTGHRTDT